MTTMPLGTARDKLSALVESVVATHDRVVITRNGQPAAVLISFDDLDALEETVDVLSDGSLLRRELEQEEATAMLINPAALLAAIDARP
jgi:prevent-host-death family protein